MNDIPTDIRLASEEIVIHGAPAGSGRRALVSLIASAILSERHRCAVIARNWQTSSFQDEHYAANTIADRIMSDSRGGE